VAEPAHRSLAGALERHQKMNEENTASPFSLPGRKWAAVRETLYFLSNLLIAESIFTAWCWAAWVPGSATRGEAVESVALMALLFFPMGFVVTYVPARLVSRRGRWWPALRGLTLGPWLTGFTLGVLLGVAATCTRLFWVFIPVIRLLGLE